MNDVTTVTPVVLPEWIEELIERLQSMPKRQQHMPYWLPARLRKLAMQKEWGPFGTTLEMDQPRIDNFAEAINDFQELHINAVLAKLGPFEGIVAHGDLTTCLDVYLIPELGMLLKLAWVTRVEKYGKLLRPVRLGALVRMHLRILSCHRPKRGEGVEMFYEFEAMQRKAHEEEKRAAIGFGTIICTPKALVEN